MSANLTSPHLEGGGGSFLFSEETQAWSFLKVTAGKSEVSPCQVFQRTVSQNFTRAL